MWTIATGILYFLSSFLISAFMLQKNHIFTSGASGTNAAVIRGALRAEKPELLTVILPQSLKMQPPESQELLSKVFAFSIFCLMSNICFKTSAYLFINLFDVFVEETKSLYLVSNI
uniref:Uncharacterized protein n=1 Tax=Nelumbo nucifera TaxID=4432 RepID=A0A822ZFR6_NELNU|nr:TPA_asm: hypothetical protein HUJ06_001580 [Nelumbo nucifera]